MKPWLAGAAPAVILASACASPPAAERAGAAGAGARCPDVLDYAAFRGVPNRRVDYRAGGVTVVAAGHSRDPADEQFGRIAALFAETRPTIALFEGPDRGIRPGAGETIRETGESGYLRFLADGAGIPARSLEPPPLEQLQGLMRDFPVDQVFLFFVLREATRMRDREGKSGAALDAAVVTLLGRVQGLAAPAGIQLPFADVAELQAAFARYWPGRDWRTADARWFSPIDDDASTGGVFTGAINRADSTNRNRNLVRLIVAAVAAGERPFALIGGSHVPMIRPALDCALRGSRR